MKLVGDKRARTDLYHRYSKLSDTPLLVLALLMIPLLVVPEIVALTPDQGGMFEALDWFIYAAFAADFVVKMYLAPSKWRHVRENWLDVVVLLLPLLRPLRILRGARLLRLLRAARLLVFAYEGLRKLRGLLAGRGLNWVILSTMAVVVTCAGLVTVFERDGGGTIKGFGDGLWWAMSTVTTVGYGDVYPATAEGRGIAVLLMVLGIVFYSILTANVAAYFVESASTREDATLEIRISELTQQVARLEAVILEQAAAK
jgi:voltage-gated potassium channel